MRMQVFYVDVDQLKILLCRCDTGISMNLKRRLYLSERIETHRRWSSPYSSSQLDSDSHRFRSIGILRAFDKTTREARGSKTLDVLSVGSIILTRFSLSGHWRKPISERENPPGSFTKKHSA